ncbi:hypothetical protein SAMN04488103_102474 [Gemmobacter aquatilis]|uniref:Divergent polysaccharide deacetylase n=1 Tax=Gemmobacter aquatilis TaxID=933059 RepID=A0A1H8CD52_9RHOB|nr:divergent polysaccharide deacetylase family protein [Gemmobacter aquatilis]SEM93013.1 hypothetical protein SAMN04488103_102474 [Gemmobacter aquatilis]
MRGFVSGLIWGGVVAITGLALLSEMTPLPKVVPPVAAPANSDSAPVAAAPEPAVNPAVPPQPAPVASPPEPPEATTEPVAEPAPEVAPAPPEPVPPPQAAQEPPVSPAPPAPDAAVPALAAPAAAPETPDEPAAPMAGAEADAVPGPVDLPPVPPLSPEEEAALAPLPNEVPPTSPLAPDLPEPPVEVPSAEPAAPSEPLLDRPEPGLPASVEGVTTDRLPAIDATPAPAPAAEAATPEGEDTRPVHRFAASFDNPAGKPLYAVLLVDDGAEGLDRAALASLPLPVTIALDPASPEAAAHAALYRAAGKEVVMLATGLPKGAKPEDIAVAFEANAKALPEAVAVLDLSEGGFQNDRPLASAVVPVIKDQGRGLVTFERGLNAADQVARREAVPAAVIFRQLDAAGETGPVIRRYLDRAAFKAAQDGHVAVLGHATPETIATLLEWSVEGRAGSVALAPLTAILQTR